MEFDVCDILSKQFKLHRASPLYNFKRSSLKAYAKKLNEDLSRIIDFNFNKKYTIHGEKSSIESSISIFSNDTYDVLEIKVVENEMKNFYHGFFISCEENTHEKFTSFPILLVEANKKAKQVVNKLIGKYFDCNIYPVTIAFTEIIAYFIKVLKNKDLQDNRDSSVVSLQYHIPGLSDVDKITLNLSFEDTAVVLSCVNNSSEITEPIQFYDKLLLHILKAYALDMRCARLFKIQFPDALIATDGKIKWRSEEAANLGLTILQEFFTSERYPCLNA